MGTASDSSAREIEPSSRRLFRLFMRHVYHGKTACRPRRRSGL
jgi:hypothetical protein